jgi:hypothetical protein
MLSMSDTQTFGSLREKIVADNAARRADYAKFGALILRAEQAGREAGQKSRPTPMIVGEAKSLFSNEIDYSKQTHYVSDGVCGFGWVHIPKANNRFVNWLKKQKIGGPGHPKGWRISCYEFNQSMQRKEAYCSAYAKVLREGGIDCYPDSIMD